MTRRRNLQPWERTHIANAYRNGEKVEAIAAEFGVSHATVNNARKAAGLPARHDWASRGASAGRGEASRA